MPEMYNSHKIMSIFSKKDYFMRKDCYDEKITGVIINPIFC
jgi:hypothetical protein